MKANRSHGAIPSAQHCSTRKCHIPCAADEVDPPLPDAVMDELLAQLNAEPHTLNMFVREMREHWRAVCAAEA